LLAVDDSLASDSITVMVTTDEAHSIAPTAGTRPRRLSTPIFKVESGLISPIGWPSATASRFDALAQPERHLDSVRGEWNDLVSDLASVQRRSSLVDDALAAFGDDSAGLFDDVLDDLF
jgi:hypothetical protein